MNIDKQNNDVADISVRTHVFYGSSVDKKVVRGLLAKANKTKHLLVNSKSFDHERGQGNKNRVSVTAPRVPCTKVKLAGKIVDAKDNTHKEIGAGKVSLTSIVDNQSVLFETQSDIMVDEFPSSNNALVANIPNIENKAGVLHNVDFTCTGLKDVQVTSGTSSKQYVNSVDNNGGKCQKKLHTKLHKRLHWIMHLEKMRSRIV